MQPKVYQHCPVPHRARLLADSPETLRPAVWARGTHDAGWMRRVILLVLGCTVLLSVGSPTAAATAQLSSPRVSAPHWRWPTDLPRVIVRPYIAPATPYAAGHRGIDVEASSTVVFAPADGIVHFSGLVVDRSVLSISHVGGLLSSYEPVDSPLVAGDIVHRGDVIGQLQPGHCSTPCLHFGVRLDGEYVSPLNYLGGIPRSVLLPTAAG
jgi:murein DD-endopeptidase MepM/ murein hydrolase activator NlpD